MLGCALEIVGARRKLKLLGLTKQLKGAPSKRRPWNGTHEQGHMLHRLQS
jgi:hypothetical protein